jgi:putative transposase
MTAAWFTARQLADLALPSVPRSESAMIRRATRERWQSRDRAASGGGREYAVTSLPTPARAELLRRAVETAPMPTVSDITQTIPAPPQSALLADWQRRTMDARAAILLEVERLAALGSMRAAMLEIVTQARAGTLPPHLRGLVAEANARGGKTGSRQLSLRTLYRWHDEAKRGVAALAPVAPPPAEALPLWAAALLNAHGHPSKPKLATVLRQRLPELLPPGVEPPSYATARRFLARMSIVDRERGRRGPNELLAVQAFKRRSTEGLQPLQVVTADGHSFKADIAHPMHGNPFRPEVCALMDTATRYVFGWSAGLAESSAVVMDTIRCGVERLGQFGIFYTDNGSGFVAQAMTDEVFGLLGRIGATAENSTPGRAQARGKIERLQQTLWKAAARELPTYAGRDMDREARRRVVKLVQRDIREVGTSRGLMPWDAFLAWIGQVVERYNATPHRGLPRVADAITGRQRHMSPAEALADHKARGWQPRMIDAAQLDDLFRPYEMRVTRRGEVRLPWGIYFNQALVPHGGNQVLVGYDIHDGSRVWVRTEEGRLICIAERGANVIPEQPASKVEHALAVREAARLKLLEGQADLIRAERRGPQLIEQAVTPPAFALDAAFEALHAETVRRFEAPAPAAAPVTGEDAWYARACALAARRDAGEALPDADAEWLAHAVTRPWFTQRRDHERRYAEFMARTAPVPPAPSDPTPARKTA